MRNANGRLTFLAAGVLAMSVLARSALAQGTGYLVTVDTSSLNAQAGTIDLQFNAGALRTQNACVNISHFSSDGSLGSPSSTTGSVSGTLATTLTINNGGGGCGTPTTYTSSTFNDYDEPITFGSTLSFFVALSGPAVTSPAGNNNGNSGSSFGVAFTTGGNPALTGDASNFAGTITLNPDGTVSTTGLAGPGNTSSLVTIQSAELVTVTTSPSNLSFSVDSTPYSSSQTFAWAISSNHALTTTSPQGTSGTRQTFSQWSDGSTATTDNITVSTSTTTYIAEFRTSYLLTMGVNPNPATGAAQNFVLEYSDTGGYGVLTSVGALFNSSLTSKKACYVYYVPQSNRLYLQNDNGQGATSITPGSGTLTNGQCTINGSSTSVVTSGNNLTLNLAVTASSSFEGPKNIYMYAADNTSGTTGWVKEGTWTPSAAFVPSIVSASPNPASGPSQNFVLEYADTGGYGALTSVAALFNSSLSSKNACYVYYVPQSNLLYLQNDSGQGATSITPGSGTLMNSQCTITGSSTTVVTSGNNLTLNLAVMASSSFEGPKNIYMYAADNSSANTGWPKEGTWTPSAAFVPSIVSASPNPAVGPSQNFVLEYSDTGGYGALISVAALFNSSLSSKNACYVYYSPQTNLLYLQNDNGQGATSITPGSGTLMNSQCTINGSSTSVTTSGNNLTLNLAVMGSLSFTGIQKIYMKAADDSGASSGWVDEGTWAP